MEEGSNINNGWQKILIRLLLQIVEKYALYADARINKYGPKRPNVRTLMKVHVYIFCFIEMA
jgi:hypothetical protein